MISITLAGLLLAGTPQTTSPAPDTMSAMADTQAKKKICRRIGATGTRVGGPKKCQTRAQWDEESARNIENANQSTGQFRTGR